MPTVSKGDDGWHLDKKVPIGIIFTILLQFAGGLWFVSKLDARIATLEATQMMQRDRDDRQDRAASDALKELHDQLKRIDDKLDRLIEKGSRR